MCVCVCVCVCMCVRHCFWGMYLSFNDTGKVLLLVCCVVCLFRSEWYVNGVIERCVCVCVTLLLRDVIGDYDTGKCKVPLLVGGFVVEVVFFFYEIGMTLAYARCRCWWNDSLRISVFLCRIPWGKLNVWKSCWEVCVTPLMHGIGTCTVLFG